MEIFRIIKLVILLFMGNYLISARILCIVGKHLKYKYLIESPSLVLAN